MKNLLQTTGRKRAPAQGGSICRLWFYMRQLMPLVLLLSLILLANKPASSQATSPAHIYITGANSDSAPLIELFAYGRDAQGRPVNLANQPLAVEQNGTVIEDLDLSGVHEGGLFTVFIIDVTPGVAGKIPGIQQIVIDFAAEPTMREQVDYVAVYRVGETAVIDLQEPTFFHNTIRNLFARPLEPDAGRTALLDSVGSLLGNLERLSPEPALVPAIVLFSDGTDAVSSQYRPADIPRMASEIGVPVHTIWLNNENLSAANRDQGRQYMEQVAAGSGGIAISFTDSEGVQQIYERIAAFRNQTIVRYELPDLVGGDYDAALYLQDNPNVRAATTISIAAGAPSVVINLPPEQRSLTLANPDDPVELSFSASVSWLDGVEREISRAHLLVNGVMGDEIEPAQLERFNISARFRLGENSVQVVVVDEQGNRAASPEIILTVSQGETELPPEIQPAGRLDQWRQQASTLWAIVGGCLLLLVIIGLLALVIWAVRKWGIMHKLRIPGLLRRIPFLRPYIRNVAQVQRVQNRAKRAQQQFSRYAPDARGQKDRQSSGKPTARPPAFLEVMEAVSQMQPRIELDMVELRLGRSPSQADVALENDITVSRIHATIVQEGADYRIFDEQSTSGTWVNEQRVPEYGLQLVDGDEIRLGAVRLRFRQP